MNRPRPVLQRLNSGKGAEEYLFWCPGCEAHHYIRIASPEPGPRWTWNENLFFPTVSPSIIVAGPPRCHLFIHQGLLQFLPDSDHALAGQTVDMVPLDEIFTEPPPPG